MNPATFEKELSKYKLVRQPDFYRSREKKIEATKFITAPKTIEPAPTRKPVAVPTDLPFWEQMSTGVSEIIPEKYLEKFMTNLKKVYKDANDIVNLEDLELFASTL